MWLKSELRPVEKTKIAAKSGRGSRNNANIIATRVLPAETRLQRPSTRLQPELSVSRRASRKMREGGFCLSKSG